MRRWVAALIMLALAIPMLAHVPARAQGKVVITVIAFNKGLAWRELFDKGDTETARLKEFEDRENIDVRIEWGDEAQVRQKVAVDLASRAGKYDVILVGSDGAVQTYA